MKAVLLQLPVQSHTYTYSLANIPLAAGGLAAYAAQALPGTEILVCPPEIASLGGDAAILHWIEGQAPDVVGLSLYLWNSERSLSLCSRLKERLPGVVIVLGGPEVTPENDFVFAQEVFDYGVTGEGEVAFAELLAHLAQGAGDISGVSGLSSRREARWGHGPQRDPLPDLSHLPSPFLAGLVRPGFNREMLLESVRGCPYRCSFCYYHKRAPKVRAFDLGRIAAEVLRICEQGARELTFLDPCFTRRPALAELLEILKAAHRSHGLGLNCELNAEDLTPELVEALVGCGLKEVEIGLQTTNPAALALAQRRFEPASFLRGVSLLRAAGVRVRTDVMVGLAGDTLEDVQASIAFVLEHSLADELALYPVSVLPGTRLWEQAASLGVRHLRKPPYYVLATREMLPSQLALAFVHAELLTGNDYFPVSLPRAALTGAASASDGPPEEPREGLINHLVLEKTGSTGMEPARLGQGLAIEIASSAWLDEPGRLARALTGLLEANPYTLLDWIIKEECFSLPGLDAITALGRARRHPLDCNPLSTTAPGHSQQVFLASSGPAGTIHTRILPDEEPLWAMLPPGAPRAVRQQHLDRLERLLGYRPQVLFHEVAVLERGPVDAHLGSWRLGLTP